MQRGAATRPETVGTERRASCIRSERGDAVGDVSAGERRDMTLVPLAQAAPRIGVDVPTLRAWSEEGLLALVARGGTPHVPLAEIARVRRALGFVR